MSQSYIKCPKHHQNVIFVCCLQDCHDHRLICHLCKEKQTIHFSHHLNYIHKIQQLSQFANSKGTLAKLQKGIQECENSILGYKRHYNEKVKSIIDDFSLMKEEFIKSADNYQRVCLKAFEKEMEKFDLSIQKIKKNYKEYSTEKSYEGSFFNNFFERKKSKDDIQAIVRKNAKEFNIRAELISLKSLFHEAKSSTLGYKTNQKHVAHFGNLQKTLVQFAYPFFEKFSELLSSSSKQTEQVKKNLISQLKSLTQANISLPEELKRKTSVHEKLKKVEMPQLNQLVKSTKQKLKPLSIPPHIDTQKGKQGPFLYESGVYYGQYKGNKRCGWGIFIFDDGCLYEGSWQNDMMCGYGRLIKNNCVYEGHIKENKANGSGKYEDELRTYAGEWKNDKRNGFGQEEFLTKNKKYIGNFVNDQYEGKGKLVEESYIYEGKFKGGLFFGKGKIVYNNRQIFQGQFKEGKKVFGKHSYTNGSYYDGSFKNDMPDGTGQFHWIDGLKYVGQWKNGLQDGVGSQVQLDGKELKGIWKNSQWQKWI